MLLHIHMFIYIYICIIILIIIYVCMYIYIYIYIHIMRSLAAKEFANLVSHSLTGPVLAADGAVSNLASRIA